MNNLWLEEKWEDSKEYSQSTNWWSYLKWNWKMIRRYWGTY